MLRLSHAVPLAAALILAGNVLSATAQGTKADYDRAMSDSQRFSNCVFRASVTPHWLPGNNAFWYRVDTSPTTSDFVFVDAAKGVRRSAFDAVKLAPALSRELGHEVKVGAWPFTWIQPDVVGAWVRFRIADKGWQFNRDGTLHPYEGTLNEEKLAALDRPHPSWRTGEATAITFINRLPQDVVLYWITPDGDRTRYDTVPAGGFLRRGTFSGHVWVATVGNSDLGAYEATNDETQVVLEKPNPDSVKPHAEPKQAPEPTQEDAAPQPLAPQITAFTRGNNVWTREAGGRETQLTASGTPEDSFRGEVFVSPDGKYLAAMQVKPAQQHKVYLVESSPRDQVQPKLKPIDYLKPGDRIEQPRPRLFDLTTRREVLTSDALFSNPWDISPLGWSSDGGFRFLFNQRGHQNLRVLEIGTDGTVRPIVDEHSDTFIDYSQKTYFYELPATHELIWASERDGWNHLYLYDTRAGKVKNQITKGQWVMREVERVDEAKRQVWFRGFGMVPGQDPYYAQLARINFDGTGLTLLTEGDGTHKWKFSPDNRFLVDTYSRVDAPPVTTLRNAQTGALVSTLETADIKSLVDAGWSKPERFMAVGRDSKTPVYGILVRPSNFDPTKKYPVLEEIYAGPQDFFTPKAFDTLNSMHQWADLGFIVVQVDGMCTNWRSKAFHDVCWKNLHDGGLPDHIAWLQAAAKTRPWLDLSRVGIEGVSAGGQNALAAMLWHGDFYKAAVADSGCHDNRMDKIWWNEAWMGWPVGPEYAANSNVVNADKLQGALMLIYGEMDTNVDPSSTLQVVNALIKANKDFDLLAVPGGGHGAGGSPYGTHRRMQFFVRHLQGVEPQF